MNKKYFIYCFICFAVISINNIYAQSDWIWARNPGKNDVATCVTNDSLGNVYVAGGYNNSTLSIGDSLFINGGGTDAYLVKYNSNGNVIWSVAAGGSDSDVITSVCYDRGGYIYVTGFFYSPKIIFGAYTLFNSGGADFFLIKYDLAGNVIWAVEEGGTGNDFAYSVAVDLYGDVYLCGNFSSNTLIDGVYFVNNFGGNDAFVSKFDKSGSQLWTRNFGGSDDDFATSVCVDYNGSVFICGYYLSSFLHAGSGDLVNSGNEDLFLIKMQPNGAAMWGVSVIGSGNERANCVATDISGNVYIAGYFDSTMSVLATDTLFNNGGRDIFLTKYDSLGHAKWCRIASGANDDYVNAICVDSLGFVYIAGGYRSIELNFGSRYLENQGGTDVFLAKYSDIGTLSWLKNVGNSLDESTTSLVVTNSNTLYAVGGFMSPILSFGTNTLVNNGYVNAFLSKNNNYDVYIYDTVNHIVCQGTKIHFMSYTNKDTNVFYQWMINDTIADTGNSFFSSLALHNGDLVNCILKDQLTGEVLAISNKILVTVIPIPDTGMIIGSATVCVGDSINVYELSAPGFWTMSNGSANIDSQGVITGVLEGIDTIMYTISSFCGIAVSSKVITVSSLPVVPNVSGATVICSGSHLHFSDSLSGGMWGATNAHAVVSDSGLVYGISAGIDTISYSVSNECGTGFSSKVVTVNPLPFAGAITGLPSVCVGDSVLFVDVATGGVWSVSNYFAMVSTGGSLRGMVAGIDTIKYTVTNACGVAVSTRVISILPLPTVGTISGTSEICEGADIVLTNPVTGGAWSVSNTHAIVSSSGLIYGVTSGIDTIRYTISNSCGIVSAQKVVTIHPLPFAGFISGVSEVCAGDSILLIDTVITGYWGVSNGMASVSSNGRVTGILSGVDTVIFTDTNFCGTAKTFKTITVNSIPFSGSIVGDSMVCIGALISLYDSAVGGTWSAANNYATISSEGLVVGLGFGVDTFSYSIINDCGISKVQKIVSVNALPDAGVISCPNELCVGDSVIYSSSVTGGLWSLTNGRAVLSATKIKGFSKGIDTLDYTVSNSCGIAIASYAISIISKPYPGLITGGDTLCIGSSLTLTDSIPGGIWYSLSGKTSVSSGIALGLNVGVDTIEYSLMNSCGISTASHGVVVLSLQTPSISGVNYVCVSGFDTLFGSPTGGYWGTTNGHTSALSGGIINGISEGSDTVLYHVSNFCGLATDSFPIFVFSVAQCDSINGVAIFDYSNRMDVFPNPAIDEINFNLARTDEANIRLFDIYGRTVCERNVNADKVVTIELKMLTPGVYCYQVTTREGVKSGMFRIER